MAIQIIDGFQINVSAPIDNRIVASGSAARNAIPYKYEGLRVFDLSNGIPYVWYNGAWVSENATGIAGSGNAFYIPRFSSSNIITNSFVYQDGDIIKTDDVGGGVDLIQLDAYYGSVTAQSFVGDGYQVSNINGSNLNVGSLPINRIVNGSNGWLFSGGSGSPTYVNPTQVSVGTASVSSLSVVANNTANATNYVTFVSSTSGNNPLRVHSTGIRYNPGLNQLSLPDGSIGTPTLTIGIAGSNGSGFYKYGATGIGISTGGLERMTVTNDGIRMVRPSIENIGTFQMTAGTATSTIGVTIASVATYDRVVYLFSDDLDNAYYISGGNFHIMVFIGSDQIYSRYCGSDSAIKTFQSNFSFILPAGLTGYVRFKKSSLTWNSGTGPTFRVKSYRLGLSVSGGGGGGPLA